MLLTVFFVHKWIIVLLYIDLNSQVICHVGLFRWRYCKSESFFSNLLFAIYLHIVTSKTSVQGSGQNLNLTAHIKCEGKHCCKFRGFLISLPYVNVYIRNFL
jgi:hypothetical protein